MKIRGFYAIAFVVIELLAGCSSAMLVPESNDPATKLVWAKELIDHQSRPLPAEKLIRESIDIYQGQKNEVGLADAYRVYGLFFNSSAVTQMHKYYQENGFRDKSATYETRNKKALEYFEKARAIFEKNEKYDRLANVYLQIGLAYEQTGDIAAGCEALDKSLEANQTLMKKEPNAIVALPKQYSTYKDGIIDLKNHMGCKP